MADNKMLEIATEVMINRFGLDETEYQMFTFSEGSSNVSIGMTNGNTPVKVTFPKDDLQFEIMKKWDLAQKEAYVKNHIDHNLDFPEKILEDPIFTRIITSVEMGVSVAEDGLDIDTIRANVKAGDKLVVNLKGGEISVNAEESTEGIDIVSGKVDKKEEVEETKEATEEPQKKKKATTTKKKATPRKKTK